MESEEVNTNWISPPPSRKGRRIALASAAGALLAAAATGFALREPAMERWWLWRMESEEDAARQEAIAKLAEMGSAPGIRRILEVLDAAEAADVLRAHRAAVPAVARTLKEPREEIRNRAALALGRYVGGPAARDLVPFLVDALKDPSKRIRAVVAEALGEIGPDAEAAVPALLAALEETVYEEPEDADEAADPGFWKEEGMLSDALRRLGAKSAPAMFRLLVEGDEHLRAEMRSVFYGMAGDAVPAVLPYLASDDWWVRHNAAEALSEMRPNPAAVPLLLRALNDENPFVRRSAMRALVSNEALDPESIAAFRKALGNEDWHIRAQAAKGLRNAGSSALASFRALSQLAFDEEKAVRLNAVQAIGKLGAGPDQVVEILERVLLADQNPRVREEAVMILGTYRARSVPTFIRALRSPDLETRRQAALGLCQLGPVAATATPALIEVLKEEDEALRLLAVAVLGCFGRHADEAVPVLQEMLRAAETEAVRLCINAALNNITQEEADHDD